MRKLIMGIDLGTVHSCVAVPDGENLHDVIVVTDEHNRSTMPSVVYKAPDGKIEVGHRAKQRMGIKRPGPVIFIKRYMGKDHTVKLGDEDKTPEEISAEILKALKNLVKDRLGDDISQAVITIPARFELTGQQATVEAARLAGLDVLTTLPEPVAAALAYGLQDAHDNIKIFCFDLGGGTFDATVMSKHPEAGIEVLTFDGNAQLGGYDLDKAVANWMLAKLQENYSLDLDWDKPEDQAIFEKLLKFAEEAKKCLSSEPEVYITKEEAFKDHGNETVSIDLLLTRTELEDLIRPFIDEAMAISKRAIDSSGLNSSGIDRVIMVGGSSKIPLVKTELAKCLDCTPELVDPDMIVARGAAIKAASMVGSLVEGIRFLTEVPGICALDHFDIHGQLTIDDPADKQVIIERDDSGYEAQTSTDMEGKFSFTDIELEEEEENTFEITVTDADITHTFSVTHNPERNDYTIAPGSYITQDISLMLAQGLDIIFKEGETIPAATRVPLRTINKDATFLSFRVLNGNHDIGEVIFDDLPKGLPAHSALELDISISDDLVISGQATLAASQQTTAFSFRLPKPTIPSLSEMRDQLASLQTEMNEVLTTITDPMTRTKAASSGHQLITAIQKEFDTPPCDEVKLFRLLGELNTTVGQLAKLNVMEPPLHEFDAQIFEARDLVKKAEKAQPEQTNKADFPSVINGIEVFGHQAHDAKDAQTWQAANRQIKECIGDIYSIINIEPISNMSPEQIVHIMQQQLEEKLGQLHAALQEKLRSARRANYIQLEPELDALVRNFQGIDPYQADQAQNNLRDIYMRADRLDNAIQTMGGVERQ